MKPLDKLTPDEVVRMPLKEFEQYFHFRPRDALEKHFFAATGKRITPFEYQAVKAGVLGDYDLSHVVMED